MGDINALRRNRRFSNWKWGKGENRRVHTERLRKKSNAILREIQTWWKNLSS